MPAAVLAAQAEAANGVALAETPAMPPAINGIALLAPGEALSAEDLLERAHAELLRQEAVRLGLLPAHAGLTAPELSADEQAVIEAELRRINARPALFSFGVWMLGPVLLEYATEEQKKRFLPQIVRGETRWCQGYSEPGAGSDLASLQTKCEDKGDHWLINGSKIWTSYANHADWIFCLVRTDFTKKHEGISFVLFDMTSPGVETRPILLISGSSPFCETFFTDVKVPKEQMVGVPGKGSP